MGGKSGGGARTPVEAPNTLWTAQSLRILDAVSEGVVEGFANGNDYPFKSIFFNDTPVQNPDGTYNFKGVNGYFLRGTSDQPYVPGFSATERSVAVATQVKKAVQVVRTVTDNQVSRLRVTVGVNRNVQINSKGDSVPATTVLLVELVNAGGVKATKTFTFKEKSSGVAYVDHVFSDLPATPFNLRVTRVTADANDDKTSNETYFSGYVEIIDAKLSYPHTALAALELDSDQFGSSTPRRNYLIKGRVVRVPSNYNPETRTYSGTLWDGTFKSAWTNNPAWVFYDLLTSERVSTIARRMSAADIDKWSLYKVARYCDQLVDDGFGGKEPRFVCNAYIADTRQAGELLTDLASVFCGMPVWNGNQVSVTLDMDADPVASYTNSNVVDGVFTYSGVALKAIHTAVHVQYVDKYDGYRTKTEYVEDSAAVKRYGLNIKSVTAFGCDSRGQATRFGAWMLQTALRQQHALSFTVGREGMKHLPYDIIQVADNNYAGAQISGRVLAVAGRVLTLDKEVESAVGAMLSYVTETGVKTVKVTAQPAGDKVQLETAVPIAEMDTWVLSAPVKSRLYRAMGVSENTSDGTYTISALLHDPRKYAVVDGWADFDKEITTLHTLTPELINTAVSEEGGTLKVTWDSTTTSGETLSYDIVIYRNGQRYRELTSSTPEFSLEGLPNGDYYAEIRGRNARGTLSEPKIVAWSTNYTLTGLRATSKMFAIGLNWVLPKVGVSKTRTEIWYGTSNDINVATKLAALPYPQTSYTLTDVKISDRYWFWARLVDDAGNTGEFTAAVEGVADSNPAELVKVIQKEFTESELTKDLIALLEGKITEGLLAEANSRTAAIDVLRAEASAALLAKASELGTKITNVENVNASQAQQINTVTAAQGATAAGLETEKKARADGDAAEAAARTALAARVTTAEGSIVRNDNLRVTGDKANADAISAMGVRVGSAESGITNLQQTVATNNEARATEINTLRASLNAGGNLMPDSEFKYGMTHQQTKELNNATQRIGFDFSALRSIAGKKVGYLRRMEAASNDFVIEFARVAVEAGKTYQFSLYVQRHDNQITRTTIFNRPLVGGAWNATGVTSKAINNNTPAATRAATTLGVMTRLVLNVAVAADAPTEQMSLALNCGVCTDANSRYVFFTQPMICEVSSLDAEPVPYSPGSDPTLAVTEASFTEYKDAQVTKEIAQATQISSLQASINNGSSGTNLIPNSDFAAGYDGWSMFNWSNTAGLTTGFNLEVGAVNKYNLKDERVFFVRDDRTAVAGATYLQVLAQNNRARFAVTPGEVLQGSVLAAGIAVISGIEAVHVYIDFYDINNVLLGRGTRNIGNAKTPATGHLNGGRSDGAYTSLDRFHTLWANEVVPAGAVWGQLSVRFWFNPSAAVRYGFFVRPQVCTVPSLSHGYVPYQVGTQGLSAQVTQASSAVTTLDGKVQAMHTVKVEALSGGRKVVAGLALGADGATGDSQVLIYADKFGLVNPSSKVIDVPFAVTTAAGGSAKMALKGDFIATDSILARHIAANQTLKAPEIDGGSLSIGNGRASIASDGSASFTNVNIKGNITATSGSFKGTVYADRLEGDIYKPYRATYIPNGIWEVKLPAARYPRLVKLNKIRFQMYGSKSITNASHSNIHIRKAVVKINGITVENCAESSPLALGGYASKLSVRQVSGINYYDQDFYGSYGETSDQWYSIRANTAVTVRFELWRSGGGNGTNWALASNQEDLDQIPQVYVTVCSMPESDAEYNLMLGALTWQSIGINNMTSTNVEARSDGSMRFYDDLVFPEEIFGVKFEYFGNTNGDWNWGLNLNAGSLTQVVKAYNRSHPGSWTSVTQNYGTPVQPALFLSKNKHWQYMDVRNIQVYTNPGRF